MCFAFSSWRDSLTSAQATLGAKPNHGFFHCQHPDAKKFARLAAHTQRARCPEVRTRCASADACARHASGTAKRNIFFSDVLFHAASRRPSRTHAPTRAATRPPARMKADESASFDDRRNGPDFASHKPECAELRERCADENAANDPLRSAMRASSAQRSARRTPCRWQLRWQLDGMPTVRRPASCTAHRHRFARRRRASDGQEKSRPRVRTASRCRLRGGVPRRDQAQCSSSSSSSA